MARSPPAGDGEPDLIEFGIPVLDDRQDTVELAFPATRDEVAAELGDLAIPFYAHGHTVALGEALDRVDESAFETRHDLPDALHPALEGCRHGTTLGLVGRLRTPLPLCGRRRLLAIYARHPLATPGGE